MPYAVATREPDRAASFLEALTPLGLTGLAMPVTTTVAVGDLSPLAVALASLQPGELVALASARASELVVAQLTGLGLALPHVGWWAVGESSAAPLRQLGYSVSVAPRSSALGLAEAIIATLGTASSTASVPAQASYLDAVHRTVHRTVDGIVDRIVDGTVDGLSAAPSAAVSAEPSAVVLAAPPLAHRRILLPRAEDGRDEAALALRAAGAHVDELVIYRTAALPRDSPALQAALARWRAGEVAVAALFAPSQVVALQAALASVDLTLAAAPVLFAAIGDTTAQSLSAAGVTQLVVASAPTPQAMANAVASRYPPRR
jgi:uroporphyrinogen-III synthase